MKGHALGEPHVPEAEQVATPLVEPPSATATQVVALGAHTPWHDAPPLLSSTQAWLLQATALPHWPFVHVSIPLPEHWEVPARQTPWHCVPMQVPLVHCTGGLHAPVASQVSRPATVH